jgi:hypothetical protein
MFKNKYYLLQGISLEVMHVLYRSVDWRGRDQYHSTTLGLKLNWLYLPYLFRQLGKVNIFFIFAYFRGNRKIHISVSTLPLDSRNDQSRSQILSPCLGDIVGSGIGLSYQPARLRPHRPAGRYNNPMPESTISRSRQTELGSESGPQKRNS